MILAVIIAIMVALTCCVAVVEWLAPREVKGCVCDRCNWYQHRRAFEMCYFYAPYVPIYKTPAPLNPDDFVHPSVLKKFKTCNCASQVEIELIEKLSDEIAREIDNDIFITMLVEDAVRAGFAEAEAGFLKCT